MSQGLEASIRCDRLLTASETDKSPNCSVRKNYTSKAEHLENESGGSICRPFSKLHSQHGIDGKSESENSKTVQYEAYEPSSKVSALMKNLQLDRLSNHSPPLKRSDLGPLFRILRILLSIPSVVFTCWTKMLDLIEKVITLMGLEFQRIDGKKSIEQRRFALKEFSANDNCTVMLASIDCAGLGYSSLLLSRRTLLT